jgi:hypothetical protein
VRSIGVLSHSFAGLSHLPVGRVPAISKFGLIKKIETVRTNENRVKIIAFVQVVQMMSTCSVEDQINKNSLIDLFTYSKGRNVKNSFPILSSNCDRPY